VMTPPKQPTAFDRTKASISAKSNGCGRNLARSKARAKARAGCERRLSSSLPELSR
jgi:hypothetical protein